MSDTDTDVRYPEVVVQLVGNDGNAFSILGAVRGALRKASVPADEIKEFMDEAMSGDYSHLLRCCHDWVTVE